MTRRERDALRAIAAFARDEDRPLKHRHVAAKLGIARQWATTLIRSLERQGYVVQLDGEYGSLRLTAAGRQALSAEAA